MGLNQFMGCEDRQTTGHLPYGGLYRSDAWFCACPTPIAYSGLSEQPFRGKVNADSVFI